MRRLEEAALYARFAIGLPRFLRATVTPEEARAAVARGLAARAENLVRLVETAAAAPPASPYAVLLRRAHCAPGDVQRMVARDGVEAALGALHDAGVFVSFEEFKGRRPIVRPGLEIPADERSFDTPRRGGAFAAGSSGTSGRATRTYHDLGHLRDTVPFRLLGAEAHGVRRAPLAIWLPAPPGVAGVNMTLSSAAFGNPPERWFAPVEADGHATPLRQGLAMHGLLALSRLSGTRLALPEPVPFDDPSPIVDWLAGSLAHHGRCELRTFASWAIRVARAARLGGVDLTGAVLSCGGEATTPAKQAEIEAAGARAVSFYAITECGPVGMSCPHAADARQLHVASDRLAVISRPMTLEPFATTVDALFLTTLLPGAPKVMLNVESDDCGTLLPAEATPRCGCAFEAAGLRARLHDVRSHRRLTAETVTLVHEPASSLIERDLPARFGGSLLDYQLCEEEAEDGATRLTLRIDPLVQGLDHDAAARAVFHALGVNVRIRRLPPLRTSGGKQLLLIVAADRR